MKKGIKITKIHFFALISIILFAFVSFVHGEEPTQPDNPGEYVGDETCLECHSEMEDTFKNSIHGQRAWKTGGTKTGNRCESCHGNGQEHVESGGDVALILNPGKASGEAASQSCLSCHGTSVGANWKGSTHESFDVSCVSCHTIHSHWTKQANQSNMRINENCLSCHNDMRKHLQQRSSHPLKNGLMSCVSCHNPHGSQAENAVAALTPNDKCYECHAEKRGPFLYEHQPVRENCMTCHSPHGSNQTMLLALNAPRLCQSCHLFGHHQTVPGEPTQVWNQNRSCVNCHHRIHGSNHPSGVVFLR